MKLIDEIKNLQATVNERAEAKRIKEEARIEALNIRERSGGIEKAEAMFYMFRDGILKEAGEGRNRYEIIVQNSPSFVMTEYERAYSARLCELLDEEGLTDWWTETTDKKDIDVKTFNAGTRYTTKLHVEWD